MPPKILIADDHEVVRIGVGGIVASARPEWVICGQAGNGQEAIAAVKQLQPDLVVLDITMPGMSGYEAAARIAELKVRCKILMFTMHESGELSHDARRVGASGYVPKSDASRLLIQAIETILAGGTFFGRPEFSGNQTQDSAS